jgi:hypothetical protein
LACLTAFANASDDGKKIDSFLSGPFTYGYLGLGLGIPFAERDHSPTQQSLRGLDSLLVAGSLTEGLKYLTHEPRPDTGTPDSFPSGHAAGAFAIATVRAAMRPSQAGFWFLGATAIGVSRVRLRRHHILDVVAGAAIGFGVARIELAQRHGLLGGGLIDQSTGQIAAFNAVPMSPGWHPYAGATGGFGLSYSTVIRGT